MKHKRFKKPGGNKLFKYFFGVLVALLAIYIAVLFIAAAPFLRFIFSSGFLFGSERNYVVLFQNNYELRPTGGFISAFATVKTRFGMPTEFTFEDVYWAVDQHEYVEPPKPLDELLRHPTYKGHSFRDANFDPHFPNSAGKLEWFLQKTRPELKPDGIFTIDLVLFEDMLNAVGGVEIDGKEITSQNLFEEIETMVSTLDLHDLDGLINRKSGVKEIGIAVMKKSLKPFNVPRILGVLEEGFNKKHALMYFKNERLENVAKNKRWAGELAYDASSSGGASREDFLAVVDSNYGGGKSNRYVTRNVFYTVDLENGSGHIDVRYNQPNSYSIPLSTNYRGYIRAYVPLDHNILDARLHGEGEGLKFGGKTFEIPVSSSGDVSFDVSFPKINFDDSSYNLNLWKQPGTTGDYYEIVVKLPVGMHVLAGNFESRENVAVFRGLLTNDMALHFNIGPDVMSPRSTRQELNTLNVLELEWSEPVRMASMDFRNWVIRDDGLNASAKDNVSIKNISLKNNILYIYTEGMTAQPEERYVLEINSVKDMAGNDTGERSYSFYQRLR